MAAPKKNSQGPAVAAVDPEIRSIVGGSRGIVTTNKRSAVERPSQGGVGGGVVSKKPRPFDAFVGRMVAEGRAPKGKR